MHDSNRSSFPGDFDALARQYWQAWCEQMRAAAPAAAPMGQQPWQAAIDGWSHMARGGVPAANDAVGRFNAQAQQWLGQMQQVAVQFSGRSAQAPEIAGAWRRAMEGAGVDPFLDMIRRMQGPGLGDFEQWSGDVSPMLDSMRGDAMSWLRTPMFGSSREKHERWQKLAEAQAGLQQHTQAYNALMMQATQGAFTRFESKLAECEEPGRQVRSARALFDLWIDAAEDAYAEIALSKEFRSAYAKLVDAQMRVRAGVQREVEDASAQFGMPTRTELDGAHRKIVELERQMRRMRDSIGSATSSAQANRSSRPRTSSGNVQADRDATSRAGAARPARQANPNDDVDAMPAESAAPSRKAARTSPAKASVIPKSKRSATQGKVAKKTAAARTSASKKVGRTQVQKPVKKAATKATKTAAKKAVKKPAKKSMKKSTKTSARKKAPARVSTARASTASRRAPTAMFADTALPRLPAATTGEQ